MQFVDRNFRLACIDAIHCNGQLPNVFDDTTSSDMSERFTFLDSVTLTEEMLTALTDLAPDGGDNVYLFADPEWGADNSDLYISRFDDLLLLSNLTTLWVHAVAEEGSLDLSLLLRCESLRNVSVDSFYVKPSDTNAEIVAQLIGRGVDVQIT